jgi:transcription initiation factor TFIIH subunit 2
MDEKSDKKSLRRTILLIDFSENMKDGDLSPNRIVCTMNYIQKMVDKYIENNPLSEMAILLLQDLKCKTLKKFEDSFTDVKKSLAGIINDNTETEDFNIHNTLKMTRVKENEPQGQISIMKGLVKSKKLFQKSPLYFHKEIYFITASVNSNDSEDYQETINWFGKEKIRISIISLSCDTFFYSKIVKKCQGKIVFPSKQDDFEDYIFVN